MAGTRLAVEDVNASYGQSHVLRDVSLHVDDGEVVGLLGRNGAGKTTTLRTIAGVLPASSGRIALDGEDVTGLPDYRISRRGLSYVAEERAIFPDLTVFENLKMGQVRGGEGLYTLSSVFEAFPRLEERRSFRASHLSGGEQQMLVIARALLSSTEVLLLDEPSEGLAPQIVQDILDIVAEIRDAGVSILLVEQNLNAVLELADRNYVLNNGEVAYEGSSEELRDDRETQEQLLGVGTSIEESI